MGDQWAEDGWTAEDAAADLRWQRREQLAEDDRRDAALDERLDHLPFTLREASRAVDEVLRTLLVHERGPDLPLNGLHALVLSRRARPISAVAHALKVTPQAASRLVKDLEGRGLVDTGVSPMDSRVRLVAITPAGDTLLESVRRLLFVAVTTVTDAVGEERLVALAEELADLALVEVGPRTSW